jgi:ATP-dependent RNA helicase DDX18/HAS1
VLSVARSLSSSGAMPFRSVVITGGYKWKTQVDALQAGAEMVIATPGRLAQHIEKGTVVLEDVKT